MPFVTPRHLFLVLEQIPIAIAGLLQFPPTKESWPRKEDLKLPGPPDAPSQLRHHCVERYFVGRNCANVTKRDHGFLRDFVTMPFRPVCGIDAGNLELPKTAKSKTLLSVGDGGAMWLAQLA
jgi:hypothetical protein